MVNLNFTEFFYLGRPKELAEYRRLKAAMKDEKVVEVVLSELKGRKPMKSRKKFRKRRKRFPRTPKNRLKNRR